MDESADYTPKSLPRWDLRVAAFHKYEPFMAKAARVKQTIVSFLDFPVSANRKKQNAHTFVARFNDAKLAYKRYKYASSLIPPGFDVYNLELTELESGDVIIKNAAFFVSPEAKLVSSDHESIRRLAYQIAKGEVRGPGSIYILAHGNDVEGDLSFIHALEAQPDLYGKFVCCDPDENGFIRCLL